MQRERTVRHLIALASTSLCAAAATAQAPLYDAFGPSVGDQLGHSLAPLGDLDGDGLGDYALGAPAGDGLEPGAGYVSVRSGADGAQLLVLYGEHTGDRFGHAIDGIGDLDGDGKHELIVGAPGYDDLIGTDNGAAYVFSGATGALLKTHVGADGDELGHAVVGFGDGNGDLIGDYAVAAPQADLALLDVGAVWVRSGADHSIIRILYGEQTGSLFGESLAAAGDLLLDGTHDLLVGSPGYDVGAIPFLILNVGKGYAYTPNGTLLASTTGALWGKSAGLGASAAGGEDLNGDAFPDIAFGIPGAGPNGVDSGQVRVLSGVPPYVELFTLDGAAAGDRFGSALELINDGDGDGTPDVVAGAPRADWLGIVDAGLAQVYSGATQALIFQLGGRAVGDQMGTCVRSPGSVNADPFEDVFGGAPYYDHPAIGGDNGWGRIHLAAAPAPAAYCTPKVNSAGCSPVITYAGCASLSAGDFDVVALNVLEGKAGILIWSYTSAATPFFGGTLCVKAPIVRTPVQTSFFNPPAPGAPCSGAYSFDFDKPYMASKGVGAGDVLYMQYWSRDAGFAPPNSIGLTGGLRVTVHP